MRPLEPRPISATDPLADFDCGKPSLNAWIADRALDNEKRGDSRTYVSVDSDTGRVAGYYCLSSYSVSRSVSGGWLSRNAPEPIPVILLGRLAVSLEAQGLGLGRDLLSDALDKATLGAHILGARALVAEAIDEAAGRFYANQGFRQLKGRDDLYGAPLR